MNSYKIKSWRNIWNQLNISFSEICNPFAIRFLFRSLKKFKFGAWDTDIRRCPGKVNEKTWIRFGNVNNIPKEGAQFGPTFSWSLASFNYRIVQFQTIFSTFFTCRGKSGKKLDDFKKDICALANAFLAGLRSCFRRSLQKVQPHYS